MRARAKWKENEIDEIDDDDDDDDDDGQPERLLQKLPLRMLPTFTHRRRGARRPRAHVEGAHRCCKRICR